MADGVDEGSAAMRGSVAGEPVAWAVMVGGQRMYVSWCKEMCEDEAYYHRHPCGDSVLVVPLYCQPPVAENATTATLTDAEREDLAMWIAECLRQCSAATEGGGDELAERWQGRAKRAAAMLERLR